MINLFQCCSSVIAVFDTSRPTVLPLGITGLLLLCFKLPCKVSNEGNSDFFHLSQIGLGGAKN